MQNEEDIKDEALKKSGIVPLFPLAPQIGVIETMKIPDEQVFDKNLKEILNKEDGLSSFAEK